MPPMDQLPLKTRRILSGDAERFLQRDARAPDETVVEQPAQQRHTVRHPARRIELRERMCGIRSPVTARLGHVHEPRAQRERRMAREVRDGELLIAERRYEQ